MSAEEDVKSLLNTVALLAQEYLETLENLGATQQRCNELLEENRALRAQLKDDLQ